MKGILGSSVAAILVLASPAAFAADMAVAPAPPVYTWTGFYIGANIGTGWFNGSVTDNHTGATLSSQQTNQGFLGGGQIGYNWQVSPQFVLGVEGTFDGAAFNNFGAVTLTLPVGGASTLTANANTNWVATVAGRFGYAINNTLIYAKGGGGWVQSSATVTLVTTTSGTFAASGSNTNSGWLVGGGFEYAVTPNWTAKAEYDYLGLRSWTTGIGTGGDSLTLNRHLNMFTVGMNYKF